MTTAGAGLQIAGALVGGYGALEANQRNKGKQKDLRNQAARLEKLIAPYREGLIADLAPGGEGRETLAADDYLKATAERSGVDFRARAAGSRTSGASKAQQAAAGIMEILGRSAGELNANTKADTMLAGQMASDLGAQFSQPVSVAENPYEGQAAFLSSLGANLQPGPAQPQTNSPQVIFVNPDGTQKGW